MIKCCCQSHLLTGKRIPAGIQTQAPGAVDQLAAHSDFASLGCLSGWLKWTDPFPSTVWFQMSERLGVIPEKISRPSRPVLITPPPNKQPSPRFLNLHTLAVISVLKWRLSMYTLETRESPLRLQERRFLLQKDTIFVHLTVFGMPWFQHFLHF